VLPELNESTNEAKKDNSAAKRSSRRQVLRQGSVAATAGLAAAFYVKPNMRELGIPGAYAQVSPGLGYDDDQDKDKKDKKDKKD